MEAAKNALLVHNVRRYFEENPRAWDVVCAYVESKKLPDGSDPVSLRLIDFLVRKYAKEKACKTVDAAGNQHSIFVEYEQLKMNRHKRRFDAFRRFQKQTVSFHGKELDTTDGQLAFFAWCLQSGVLDFAHANRAVIEGAKAEATAAKASESGSGTPKHGGGAHQHQQRKRRRQAPAATATSGSVTVCL